MPHGNKILYNCTLLVALDFLLPIQQVHMYYDVTVNPYGESREWNLRDVAYVIISFPNLSSLSLKRNLCQRATGRAHGTSAL